MKIFDSVFPERFFSVLVSPNRELYVRALFILKRLSERSHVIIKRDTFIRKISEELPQLLLEKINDDEISPDDEAEFELNFRREKGARKEAAKVYYQLKVRGWIDTEQLPEYGSAEILHIPDYATDIIDVLRKFESGERQDLHRFNFAVYSALDAIERAESERKAETVYNAYVVALNNTRAFDQLLTRLTHNLGRHYRGLEELDARGLLEKLLGEFAQESDKMIAQIKTYDSVYRYKDRITAIVSDLLNNEMLLEGAAEHAVKTDGAPDIFAARKMIHEGLEYVQRCYEVFPMRVENADKLNAEYVDIMRNRIEFKLASGPDLRGAISKIVEALNDGRIEDAGRVFNFTQVSTADSGSVYVPREESPEAQKPAEFKRFKPSGKVEEKEKNMAWNRFSSERIDDFVKGQMDEGRKNTGEFVIKSKEDFILMMYSSMRGLERKAPYRSKFLGRVERDGRAWPLVEFVRK